MSEHTDDLRNVNEGDSVTLTTTEGHTFDVECIGVERQHAAPETGEITETNIWLFGDSLAASITDGLASRPEQEFPQYSALWDMDAEEGYGYIEELKIHGKMEA